MGCHHFDTSFDALKLTAPARVRQTTPGSSGPLWGDKRTVEMIFQGSDVTAADTVQLTWHDGGMQPDRSKIVLPAGVKELPPSGTYWIGEAGGIFKKYGASRPVVLPEKDFPAEKYPADLEQRDHYHDWVDAILEGRQSCDDFRHGGPLTEAVLVGAMADRVSGGWLEWDRKLQQFTNSTEATALVRRAYRDGWQIPGLG
jgi:hypothetical protein